MKTVINGYLNQLIIFPGKNKVMVPTSFSAGEKGWRGHLDIMGPTWTEVMWDRDVVRRGSGQDYAILLTG